MKSFHSLNLTSLAMRRWRCGDGDAELYAYRALGLEESLPNLCLKDSLPKRVPANESKETSV